MQDIKYVTLEDNNDYMIITEIDNKETTYVYLTNINDQNDFCIRKIDKSNDPSILKGLENEAEFDKALLLFTKKYQNNNLTDK